MTRTRGKQFVLWTVLVVFINYLADCPFCDYYVLPMVAVSVLGIVVLQTLAAKNPCPASKGAETPLVRQGFILLSCA